MSQTCLALSLQPLSAFCSLLSAPFGAPVGHQPHQPHPARIFSSCKLILKLQLSAYLYLSYLFTLWLSIYLFHFKVSLSSQLRFVILHNLCYTTNIYYYSNPVNYCACSLELPSRNRCNRKLKKHTYAISQFRNPARIGIYVMAISNF